jgi:hypothetical protein
MNKSDWIATIAAILLIGATIGAIIVALCFITHSR